MKYIITAVIAAIISGIIVGQFFRNAFEKQVERRIEVLVASSTLQAVKDIQSGKTPSGATASSSGSFTGPKGKPAIIGPSGPPPNN